MDKIEKTTQDAQDAQTQTQNAQDAQKQDATIKTLSESLEAAEKANRDITAERDSLLEELNALKEKHEKLETELTDTKKLNFQLGRTIGNADYKTEQQLTEETYQQALAMVR